MGLRMFLLWQHCSLLHTLLGTAHTQVHHQGFCLLGHLPMDGEGYPKAAKAFQPGLSSCCTYTAQ